MSKFIPNSFQIPNSLVDELMAEISGIGLKCYLIITRKTTGWRKVSDKISINQFITYSGVKDKRTIYTALEELEQLGLIRSTKNRGMITEFSLITQNKVEAKNVPASHHLATTTEVTKTVVTENVTTSKLGTQVETNNETRSGNKKRHSTKDQINRSIQNIDQNDPYFNQFWLAGLPKINKQKSIKSFAMAFKKWQLADRSRTLASFSNMIVNDIQNRLAINQFGFEKLHPTTYLNNQRWEDELCPSFSIKQTLNKPSNNGVWIDNLEEEFF